MSTNTKSITRTRGRVTVTCTNRDRTILVSTASHNGSGTPLPRLRLQGREEAVEMIAALQSALQATHWDTPGIVFDTLSGAPMFEVVGVLSVEV